MASSEVFAKKKVLVLDDHAGMRSQLQMTLTNCGFDRLRIVASVQMALTKLEEEPYDIILSDYFLGEHTDGQQFLEYLRTHDIISRNTIFIMITAEQSYERVVTVSECAPDDYLLKPFTAEQFNTRLEKLLDRQERLRALDLAYDQQNWAKVLQESDKILAVKDKYFVDACKIKASTLLKMDRADEALALYASIVAMRPIPWAKLGVAKATAQQGKTVEAVQLLNNLLEEHPQYMAAYDLLSKLLADSGKKPEALGILEKAREVSPGTMSRIRQVGSLAVSLGKPELAEQVLGAALHRHRYSPVREVHDYALMSKALNHLGKTDKALELLKEAGSTFRDDSSKLVLAASEGVTHHLAGNKEKADALLSRVMAVQPESVSPEVLVVIADACFAAGQGEKASELLKHLIQNHPDNPELSRKVHTVLTDAGHDADAVIQSSAQEVIQTNNEGVMKAKAGKLVEAIALLSDAANRLPGNLQIVSNAALVLAMDLMNNGYDADKLALCLRYRQQVMDRDPAHPKLAQIDTMLKRVKRS